jgi:tetratricopeptide (TPR) repeat protein
MFGGYTAMAMDAHNLFLQFATELGTAGLLLAIIFTGYALRLVNSNRNHLGTALLFLLFKCLYTVVLTSITGMILLVLLLAALSQKRCVVLDGRRRNAALTAVPFIAILFVVVTAMSTTDLYYQQGVRSLFMGQNELAVEKLNTALMINKENSDASLALAHASYLQHDYETMHRHIQNALYYHKNKDSYKVAASMYYYAKRYNEAFELYQYLHGTFPEHLTSLTKLASIYMLRGEYEKAYAMARQVLHMLPRKEAESDEKNLRIASQIVKDSYPHIVPSINSNLRSSP